MHAFCSARKLYIVFSANFTSTEKYDVILSAYMNSGSRFTSRLLGFQPDTFFFYEPLWKFSIWDYFKPPDLSCSTTVGSCRYAIFTFPLCCRIQIQWLSFGFKHVFPLKFTWGKRETKRQRDKNFHETENKR